VEPGRTGWLVPPDDEEALAAALVEAVNDPERRAAMGDAAWTASRARYSLEAVVAGIAGVYGHALLAQPCMRPAPRRLARPGRPEPGGSSHAVAPSCCRLPPR